jgi:hypothetical protein
MPPTPEREHMKTAKFEMTSEELEVLIYILMDWRRLKSVLVEDAEYPNFSTSSTQLIRFFHHVWEDLDKKKKKENT